MSLLNVRDLSVRIAGAQILDHIDLEMTAGEIVGLVGESGSGKSMTAQAVMGLLPKRARVTGSVCFDGEELTALSEKHMCRLRGARIGMIFQEPMTALNPMQTIGDQVAETLVIHHRCSRKEARKIARERLDRVGLRAPRFPLSLYPHELSGGQRQRVAIALAIALRPALLIADEPTTALDVTTQAEILTLLQGLVRDEGMALLLITHDLAVVANMADRVVVMEKGRIAEHGATEPLFRAPRAPYTRALMQASRYRPSGETPAPGDTLLQVEHITRSYTLPRPRAFAPAPGLRAVDDVSFTLCTGESLGLVGESGCGKSTLTRVLLGLDAIESGEIRLGNDLVSPAMTATARASVQVVFQDPYGSFNPRQKVATLIAEPFHLTGRPRDWQERVTQSLKDVGLQPDDGRRYIHEFSGGQRQRIAIARALIIRPKLIVLDEAVSALDVQVRAQVLDLLRDLQHRYNLSYLFISHDLSVVRGITSRCMVMKAGKIVESGPTENLFTAPEHPYTRALLSAAPRIPEAWSKSD